MIAIVDSHTYEEAALPTIVLEPGSQLLIVAARYRDDVVPMAGEWNRDLNRVLVTDGLRPHLKADVNILGEDPGDGAAGKLWLNGLLIEGAVTVQCGELDNLSLAHCTLVPDKGGLVVDSLPSTSICNSRLSIDIERCICGPLIVPEPVRRLSIANSIIDASGGTYAIAADVDGTDYSPPTTIETFDNLWSGVCQGTHSGVGCDLYRDDQGRTPAGGLRAL